MAEHRQMKASVDFPAECGEEWRIRNGRGRVVEIWSVRSVVRTKTASFLTIDVNHVAPEA